MLKGLMITPPVIGRISIGQVVEKNGKRLPQKDDQFTLTTQIQTPDGWIKHPIDDLLRQQTIGKLREIPIQLIFNEPELNLRAEYCLFDRQSGRPTCVGNGETCQRHTDQGVEALPCPSPESCDLSQGYCKPYGRLNVLVKPQTTESTKPESDNDPISSFIFRTSGFNSIRTLASRLSYFQALSGNILASLPLALKLRGKSTRQSYGHPIYYVDLTLRKGMTLEETLSEAKRITQERQDSGYDQKALDAAANRGFNNGRLEDNEEDFESITEEFYPELNTQNPTNSVNPTLSQKLDKQAQQLNH
jgi:hypothetical protein